MAAMNAARPRKQPDMTRYTGRVAARILKRRAALGMTTDSFRDALGTQGLTVNMNTLYAWDQGRNPIPIDTLPTIARALRCEISELMPRK